ncbi:MAG: ABC transporter permease [Bacteroidota bacterium]
MFKSNFKLAWRNLWKYKRYTGINVFGLSIGIASMIILFQFIGYHLSFDGYHENADRLYRVVNDLHLPDGNVEYDPGAPLVLSTQIETSFPQVESYGLLLRRRSFTVEVNEGQKIFLEDENVALTNPGWLELMSFEAVSGNPAEGLDKPMTAVLTESLASKYFQDRNAVGEIITLDNEHQVEVIGVVKDLPNNTDFQAELFLSYASFRTLYPDIYEGMSTSWDWVSSSTELIVLFNEAANLTQAQENLSALALENMGDYMADIYRFRFQPLAELHFDLRYDGVIEKRMLTALGLISLLLVVIISVNFINLATAQSAQRSREIGVRKVMGSARSSIFWQFMTETAVITFVGYVVAFGWVSLFLPLINNWLKVTLSVNIFDQPAMVLFLLGSFVIIILGAGFYPSVVISRLRLLSALKNQLDRIQKASTQRRVLITTQNLIAQALIICTLIIAFQLNFLQSKDLGFDEEHIIMLDIPEADQGKLEYLKNQWLTSPHISSVTFCERPPSSEGGGGTIKFNGGDWLDFAVRSRPSDPDYLPTFGIELVAGRNVQPSDTAREVLVNQELMKTLEIRNPEEILGTTMVVGELSLNEITVVGVVDDFHTSYLYSPIEPLVITTSLNRYNKAAVKVNAANISAAIGQLEVEWQGIFPEGVFEYNFLSDQLAEAYETDVVISKLIRASALIAILLSCLGWLGLMSLVSVQRAKEIGVRKVLGSSSIGIIAMLSLDFLKLVLIASVLATPIAWYAMDQYLQGFTYRIGMPWWLFILSAVLSAGIVLFTISFQAIKAARVNPVVTLKSAE